MKRLTALFALSYLFFGSSQATQNNQAIALEDSIEEVIVNGRRPGPPLWRMENGENTLWIFAVVSPMPKSFEWDSSTVEHILSESQEYFPVIEKRVTASLLNPIKAIGMLRRFNKLKKIPGDRTLADYLSEAEYEQFLNLKKSFARNQKKIEKLTPLFVAQELYQGAQREYGLIGSQKISKAIDKLAKKNKKKLQITKINVREKIEPKPIFNAIENLSDAEHQECLSLAMKTLDNKISSLINYALLWADGDPQALVDQTHPPVQDVCADFFLSSQQARRIIKKSQELWLDAAQQALETNRSSFAVMELDQVIEPNGLLRQLAARGYKLIGPVRDAVD